SGVLAIPCPGIPMLPAQAPGALSTLLERLASRPELANAVVGRWRDGARMRSARTSDESLPDDIRAATDDLGAALSTLTKSDEGVAALVELFNVPAGKLLFSWCAASTWLPDVRLAPLLAAAARQPAFRDRVDAVARARVVEGPLADALAC